MPESTPDHAADLARVFAAAPSSFSVQQAMGHMWRGDHVQACTALRHLSPEHLALVPTVAAALGAAAEEIADRAPIPTSDTAGTGHDDSMNPAITSRPAETNDGKSERGV